LCPIRNPRSQRTDCRRTAPLPCFLSSWRRQYISEHLYNIQFFTTTCLSNQLAAFPHLYFVFRQHSFTMKFASNKLYCSDSVP
jgi:hypothetical protein